MMALSDLFNQRGALLTWIAYFRLSRIITCLLIVLVLLPLISHYYLSKIGSDSSSETYRSRTKLDHIEDDENIKMLDLGLQVGELKRIKASVNNELRTLESKRQKLQSELSGYNTNIHSLKNEYKKVKKDLERLQITIEQVKLEKEEMLMRNMPNLKAPKQILTNATNGIYIPPPKTSTACHMYSCFDYSRCSLLSGFPVYMYNLDKYSLGDQTDMESVKSMLKTELLQNYLTQNANIACIYLVVMGNLKSETAQSLQNFLFSLPYWHGDGRNHVLLTLGKQSYNPDIFNLVNTGRAMISQSLFADSFFRSQFDVVVPPNINTVDTNPRQHLPMMSPIHRKYLLSFVGEYSASRKEILQKDLGKSTFENVQSKSGNMVGGVYNIKQPAPDLKHPDQLMFQSRHLNAFVDYPSLMSLENIVIDILKNIQLSDADSFLFEFSCRGKQESGITSEWLLCNDEKKRKELITQSTFTLLIAPANFSILTTPTIQTRLLEALKYGSIPVVLGNHIKLPFSELLDWKRAAIILPKPRISELHFLIRTYTDNVIAEMRRQGRFLWGTYFSSAERLTAMSLAVIRTRLQIPAAVVRDEPSPSVFNKSFVPLKLEGHDLEPETDDILGPIEPPFPSEKFSHNFSHIRTYESFNNLGDPFHLFPSVPTEPVLPSEAKFFGSGYGFRPINKGAGGAGKEFSEAIGGNMPREQFTVVMLTYERETVLINALQRLKGLPHLNRVVVVWNSPRPPSLDLRWPDIGVPIKVVKTKRNSLNNRFLPFDAIETECILSIDDDVHLRHDEIIFGFRVWREARDRIVGFPGRYHGWHGDEKTWHYNASHSCELSMVLTGAAFFHKYYCYMYSYVMPQAIRDKVDEYINCEDIAMNFLVSHITRMPPLKVTSRWTFRCPGCPQALSVDETHFEERHNCINFFTQVFGYMPLLYTQHRLDSVLFKTRIPHDKQKCFRFI